MSKKTKVIIIVSVIVAVVAILAIVGFIVFDTSRQESKLRSEAEKLCKMDITKDTVDMGIKTKGDHAEVEKTMKEYINTFCNTLKEIESILEDDKISEMLTAENYKNDGPEFLETKKYISETRINFNISINTLIDMTSEKTMMKAIEDKNLSQEYIDLYKELMIESEIPNKLKEAANKVNTANEKFNKVLDTQDLVIDMLIGNRDKWSINDAGEIEFSSQTLVNEYNGYLEQIQ